MKNYLKIGILLLGILLIVFSVQGSPRPSKIVTQNDRITNVQHELGHNLGLVHTNEINGNFLQIPNTPPSDSQSVMNVNSVRTITNFSNYDGIAINYLFPCPLATTVLFSGPTNMGNNSSVTWTYDGGVPNAQYYRWWYKKIGSSGPPIIIAYGSTAYFVAQPDTFYSSGTTSYFEIYLEVEDTNGNRFTSSTVTILKRGKYKLEGGI
ncbi:reprolysin-like metallopeptidase [Confluentibacter sediminis]|uniref:reprolysin-like metallopeptidase n=1 Tax=Confluentibacter sediminis TaxID=2219045 RepID=UPI000DAD0CF7|nr:hypothetical protein [Confluentibacter sediminis]